MAAKPWLQKTFLDRRKSTKRDYPPKRKKPWLSPDFPTMEHFHYSTATPLGRIPNPCGGHRSLNFDILPSSVDCNDGNQELVFILSDDFKCASIRQISGSGVTIDGVPIENKPRDVTNNLTPTPETAFIGGDVRNVVVGVFNAEDAGDDLII